MSACANATVERSRPPPSPSRSLWESTGISGLIRHRPKRSVSDVSPERNSPGGRVSIHRLVPTIQCYDWGDAGFIADLQGRDRPGHPEAEMWMGAHVKSPSTLQATGQSLSDAVAADTVALLGLPTAERFGELPFLMKVLAAARPLSIQVHPSASQAEAGFARENSARTPLDSPVRTYRDPNPKPELVCALTRFEAKCGFRPLDSTRELFRALSRPQLDPLRDHLQGDGASSDVLCGAVGWLLGMDAEETTSLVEEVVVAVTEVAAGSPWQAEFDWTAELALAYPGDAGVVAALMLNHVTLQPGQALFLAAGNLHSYLRGAAIEIMGNSDNVLRGGLSSKHVDVDGLLSVLDCSPGLPAVQTAGPSTHTFFSPVEEFSLTRAVLDGHEEWASPGPEILVVTDGAVHFTDAEGTAMYADSGASVWVPATEDSYRVSGQGVIFRANVGTG